MTTTSDQSAALDAAIIERLSHGTYHANALCDLAAGARPLGGADLALAAKVVWASLQRLQAAGKITQVPVTVTGGGSELFWTATAC